MINPFQVECTLQSQKENINMNKTQCFYYDRFIPNRIATSNETNSYYLCKNNNIIQHQESTYVKMITQQLLNNTIDNHSSRIINYKKPQKQLYKQKTLKTSIPIIKNATKILDAPQLRNDYYLNLLAWSNEDILSILLGNTVYLYSPTQINTLDIWQDSYLCSVSFAPTGGILAVGGSKGLIKIYDMEKCRPIRTINGHIGRVSSMEWSNLLYTGGKDTQLHSYDVRSFNSLIMKGQAHNGQICGLNTGINQIATGANDNKLIIWDTHMQKPRININAHKAAVKALAYCPWQNNLIVSGGGTNDKMMKFWNTDSGQLVNQINTESQVCSLLWNRNQKEILSSHGFSRNHLCVWKYPSFTKKVQFQGHNDRVLHMALSPDNTTVCSASADQTLRFWQAFDHPQHSYHKKQLNTLQYSIR